MVETLLAYVPTKLRPYVLGALALMVAASGSYAVAAFAAERELGPRISALESAQAKHEDEDKRYLYPLLEAIWADSRALCAANPAAKCDGYNPTQAVKHEP